MLLIKPGNQRIILEMSLLHNIFKQYPLFVFVEIFRQLTLFYIKTQNKSTTI